jgi:Cu/Ag efflux protein CusF
MKRHYWLAAGLLFTFCPGLPAWAQHQHDHGVSATSNRVSTESINPWTQAEVRRVDMSASKITLKHGPIAVLGMDPMTMVFQLRGEQALKAAALLKQGDRIEFMAGYDKGAYVVTGIRAAQ